MGRHHQLNPSPVDVCEAIEVGVDPLGEASRRCEEVSFPFVVDVKRASLSELGDGPRWAKPTSSD